jgi:hypothetical protein
MQKMQAIVASEGRLTRSTAMNDTEAKRTAFDLAEACLQLLTAYYSSVLYKEEQKPDPDTDQIAQWEDERRRMMALMSGLDFNDQAANEKIRATYAPILRACRENA